MLTALVGTAFLAGWFWLAIFGVATLVFIRRIRIEEGYMLKLFPAEYPEYKKRTKALVPFLW
jgi:protein-S-isoprenylcysteine O-methyltransferase